MCSCRGVRGAACRAAFRRVRLAHPADAGGVRSTPSPSCGARFGAPARGRRGRKSPPARREPGRVADRLAPAGVQWGSMPPADRARSARSAAWLAAPRQVASLLAIRLSNEADGDVSPRLRFPSDRFAVGRKAGMKICFANFHPAGRWRLVRHRLFRADCRAKKNGLPQKATARCVFISEDLFSLNYFSSGA